MMKLNYRRIFIYTGIISLFLYYIFSWEKMIGDFYERTGSDFMGFYSYGRLSQTKGVQYIYSIDVQEQFQEEIIGHPVTVIFYTHLPFIAPLASVLVDENYVASFSRWAIVLLFLNLVNVFLLANLLEIIKFTKENLIILLAGTFLFDPTFSGLMNGQDTAILLLGAVCWASGVLSKKYFLAGVGLSLTTVRPQIALFLVIPFLFRHQKVFLGALAGGFVLATISIMLIKTDGLFQFIESIKYINDTVWRQAHAFDMPTISGIIRRSFVITDPAPIKSFVWILYLLGIAGFCVVWRKADSIEERHIGLISVFSIFLLPYAHYHDLILLLVPIFCVLRILQKGNLVSQSFLAVIPLVVSWLTALGFAGNGSMKFPIVYMIMVALGYILISSGRSFKNVPYLSGR